MLAALLLLIAILLSIPLIVIGTECLIALFTYSNTATNVPETLAKGITYKVLIPAHNEAAIIGKNLAKLIPELPDGNPKNIVLIADNCTDITAQLAHATGITVYERNDTSKRGKGFALDFGIQQLKSNPPDVVVVLDADCETSKSSFAALINLVINTNKPAQMTNVMRISKNASLKQKIAGFAWILKNKLRPAATSKLKLPALLTGTGMAFPWTVFAIVNVGHGNIVEDMQLGIDCASKGFKPVFCKNAVVYSDFPEQSSAELSQRTRWEHGHLHTILHQVPALIKEAWRQKDIYLLALALDIGVPPLSLLVFLSTSGLVFLSFCFLITNAVAALLILLLSFLYFAVMLTLIWRRFGQDYLTASELAGIPHYVFSKLSIYLSFIFKRQKEWVRTDRD